jgi:long-chain acyl-CoA synthetase
LYEYKPRLSIYDNAPHQLDYVEGTIFDAVKNSAERVPDHTACEFMGKRISYRRLLNIINRYAAVFKREGLSESDSLTLCLPNCPSVIYSLYAANKIGIIVSTIHPLSTSHEIEHFLRTIRSRYVMTLDFLWEKIEKIASETELQKVFLLRIGDEMGWVSKLTASASKRFKIKNKPTGSLYRYWSDCLKHNGIPQETDDYRESYSKDRTHDPAIILFSGGTTGKPKGILCSNRSFNALAQQLGTQGDTEKGGKMLTILPNFHGFGLGVCIHMPLFWGGTVILVPNFDPDATVRLIRKKKPEYFAGVPKLFEALLRSKYLKKTKLSCLKGVYCGGDSLPDKVEKTFSEKVRENGGTAKILQGYGLTESLTACMLMPPTKIKTGSIGIPLPDMEAMIVEPGTQNPLPVGEEGEICVSGPTVMIGYYDDSAATAEVLQKHTDGRIWLHTGDIGKMDNDGYFYFRYRMKRMIKVAGVAIYPSQIEEVLNTHPEVLDSCVIGIGNPGENQMIKAFVILKKHPEAREIESKKKELLDYCSERLIKWSQPKEIEFRRDFPKTLVGKVAYRKLELEEHDDRY